MPYFAALHGRAVVPHQEIKRARFGRECPCASEHYGSRAVPGGRDLRGSPKPNERCLMTTRQPHSRAIPVKVSTPARIRLGAPINSRACATGAAAMTYHALRRPAGLARSAGPE
jgi:hypothetical protein